MNKISFVLAMISMAPIAKAEETRKPSSRAGGSCSAAALSVAEDEYSNNPDGTHVTPKANQVYVVTVGIGNPEDGARTFLVKCQGTSVVNCGCKVDHEIVPKKPKS